MKKILIVLSLLLLVGCNIVTPTPQFTATPFENATPTGISTVLPKNTNTPESTVTPFVLPSATATLPPTPTQFVPPTDVPDCVQIPCGINHFFNPGFEGRTTRYREDWNENILTAPNWGFEYLTGTSRRNPEYQLDTPESGDRKGIDFSNRVDGYVAGVNDQAAVWFKSYGVTDAGMTQAVNVLENHCYTVGTSASTWANPDGMPYDGRDFWYSKLSTQDDRRNVEWSIRVNFNGGPVYEGQVLEVFTYEDGIYDFILGSDGKEYFGGRLRTDFCVPFNSDNDNVTLINLGFTANNMWRWGNTDYHIDNAFLYCMDCGFGNPLPTQDPNATPTPIVTFDPDSYKSVTIIAGSLSVRRGAGTDTPRVLNPDGTPKRVLQGQTITVYDAYQNETNGEIWARIDDPNICTAAVCDDSEWVAVQHSDCTNNICGILNK